MATASNNKRWYDDEDFTPEHDEMMLDLMENWHEYAKTIHLETKGRPVRVVFTGELIGEPPLSGYPTVYPDAMARGEAYIEEMFIGNVTFIYEIKPRVTSFGSTLRQLQLYKSRVNGSHVLLITNDDRFDEAFEKQHVFVIHPEEWKNLGADSV